MHPATSPTPAEGIGRAPVRRRALLAAAATAIPLAMTACGSDKNSTAGAGKSAGPVELSIFWWGADTRATITGQVLDLYTKKHPNVTFKRQWQGNSGYYDKLATMAAGDNAPDIFQIDDNSLTEYASRNIALDLSKYVKDKKINETKFPPSLVQYGNVGGKAYGVAIAENTPAMVYNKSLVQQYGLEEPQIGWSYDQLITWAQQITTKSNGKIYGTMDPSADYKALWLWLRSQGKELYNGAKLGFAAADLVAWFDLWAGARKSKAAPTADLIHAANGGDVTKQLVVTKQAATSFMWSNQLPELQKATDQTLAITAYPGDPKGQWARAAVYWSIFKGSKNAAVAADVVNFFVNDAEAGKVLGTERGLPANLDIRAAITPSLPATMQATVAFEKTITPKFGPAPAPPPKGHSKVKTLLVTVAESVQYGKASSQAAADQFMTQAQTALGA